MYFIKNFIQVILLYIFSIIVVFGFMMLLPAKLVFVFANYVWTPGALFLTGARVKANGRENIQDGKFYIFMANHSSWSDIPCMYTGTRRQLRFIAKMELKRNFILGPIMRKMDMIFIDRSNPSKSAASMKVAIKQIQEGRDIVIFPEGTRTKTGNLNRFKRGGFKLAIDAGVEIIPVGIIGSGKVWPRNNFSFRSGKITVNVGKPVSTKGLTEKDVNELSNKVKNDIQQLIDLK